MPNTFTNTTEILLQDVKEREFCTGAQVYISVDGEVLLDRAFGVDGLSRPMSSRTVSAVYCAAKPMTAILVASLIGEQRMSLRSTLGELLPAARDTPVESVRIDHILTHQAGLHTTGSMQAAVLPASARYALALSAPIADDWNPGSRAAYSEWRSWYLLGLVIEELAGTSSDEAMRERIIEPLGLSDDVFFGDTASANVELGDRVGTNVDLRNGEPVPLLSERSDFMMSDTDPSLSVYATMNGLGKFYEAILRGVNGQPSGLAIPNELITQFVSHRREVTWDEKAGRNWSFSYGFMADLEEMGFGKYVGSSAIGHTGQVGTSTALMDPDNGLVAAVLYNAVIDQQVGFNSRRPRIVSAIYNDLNKE